MNCIYKKILCACVLLLIRCQGVTGQALTREPLHRLTQREYETTLQFWEKKWSDRLKVEEVGKSLEGSGIFLLKITDSKVADSDKQVVLISALHGGPERSGTTGTLAVTEWLLSDDKEAAEVRRRQVVLVIPVINPRSYFETDRFRNAEDIDPYTGGGAGNWNFDSLTYKKAKEAPEVMAFLKVVDRYKPEVNLDLHGTGLQEYSDEKLKESGHLSYTGQIMTEVTGLAYSNSVLRPWDWRIIERMHLAGKDAGFPSDRAEADAQQMQWIPGTGSAEGQAWRGRPQFYTAQYAYMKYHTLLACLEIAWEASAVVRTRAMLRIGNEVWPGARARGYPVNKMHSFLGSSLTAAGKTAAELRNSRAELWGLQSGFSHGILYPETEGRASFVVGLTAAGTRLLHQEPAQFVKNLRKVPGINAEAIEAFVSRGPEIKLAFELPKKSPPNEAPPIMGGFGLDLRLPYADAEITKLSLNGHELRSGCDSGFETWQAEGYRHVHINVAPEVAVKMDIALVTCEYSTKTKRTYGWKPPVEVIQQLQQK